MHRMLVVICINIFFFLLYYVLSSVIFSFSCILLLFCVTVAVPNQHLLVFVLAQ